MGRVGLVLEGGGMRGLYTCGVLENFLDKELHFKYVIGVSAGASNAASYISGQKGRNEKVNLEFINDWRYMSVKNLFVNRSYFGMDFIFSEIPEKYIPFDYRAFNNAECEFIVGTTDCNTGNSVYFNKRQVGADFDILKASCSLPLLSPMVKYDNYELLDGGIADSIPIRKSLIDGNQKNVVVLTRNKDYRKKPIRNMSFFKMKYRKYPRLVEAMENRYKVYNETIDYIEELEQSGKVLVIRPSEAIEVDRLEKNPDKLKELFQLGYRDAENTYQTILEFIEG